MLESLTTTQKILTTILIISLAYFVYDYFLRDADESPEITTRAVIPGKTQTQQKSQPQGGAKRGDVSEAAIGTGEGWFRDFTYTEWEKDPFFHPSRVRQVIPEKAETRKASKPKVPQKPKPLDTSGLKLTAISKRGTSAFCLVNNEVLEIGDNIFGATVTSIKTNSIILEYQGNNYEISLSSM